MKTRSGLREAQEVLLEAWENLLSFLEPRRPPKPASPEELRKARRTASIRRFLYEIEARVRMEAYLKVWEVKWADAKDRAAESRRHRITLAR